MDQEKIESRSQQGPVVGKGMNGKGNSRKYSGRGGQGSWTKGSSKNGGNISEKARPVMQGLAGIVKGQGTWRSRAQNEARTIICIQLMNRKNGSNNVVHDTDGDVQTWCILDEREPEQWQEVITKKIEREQQTRSQTSILSVETKQSSVPPRSSAKSRIMGRMFKSRWIQEQLVA